MKKMAMLMMLAISAAAASAQANVTINANIKGLQPGQWVYCGSLDNPKKDSAKTPQDGFQFNMNIPDGEGNLYLLQIGQGYKENNGAMVYLDEGTVTITGNGPEFKDAKLSGTIPVEDLNAYSDFIENRLHMKQWQKKASELQAKNDTAGLAALQPQLDSITSAMTELSKQWVNEHTGSPISAIVISTLRGKLSMDELETLMDNLTPLAKNNIPAKDMLHSIEVNKLQLTAIGKTAPDFTQNDTLGKPVSLKDFHGKYVLVDFWASWCIPCREENPEVVKVFNSYRDKNFTILGISFDREKEDWLKAIHKDSLTWTHISDLALRNAVGKQYDIMGIPSNILIDPDGKIIAKDLYGEDLEKKLGEVLK